MLAVKEASDLISMSPVCSTSPVCSFASSAEMCYIRNAHHKPVCRVLTPVTAHILSCVSAWRDTHSLGGDVTAEHQPPYVSDSGEKLMKILNIK